CLQYQDVPRTF
nr:immunoglobulin light chain junction region [Macaca mulatta]MOW52340.1 immunoglobulin light chain junction region [Macaca mulatta]MOW52443.1 immunoglobulin light chain junction region [Macaca mulatta]MOW52479.1 immunoglobulin light chain junction region [Macaca mulatta]MOW52725.1 immunoglobulin light chain junction region [Macaca mulatta]